MSKASASAVDVSYGDNYDKDVPSPSKVQKSAAAPALLTELLGPTLRTKTGTVKTSEALAGKKAVGLYFSAHWCPPCRRFTPQLVDVYNKLKAEHPDPDSFEFVFVSSDRDAASFGDYFAEMPWKALPFEERKAKDQLSSRFGVQGIPTLVTLAPDLTTINANARGPASADDAVATFPWVPPLVPTLDGAASDLNDETVVVALVEGSDAAAAAAIREQLETLAKAAKAEKADLRFAVGTSADEVCGRVRELCGLPPATAEPVFLVLDIPDDGGYYISPGATDASAFLAAYQAGALDRQQLGA